MLQNVRSLRFVNILTCFYTAIYFCCLISKMCIHEHKLIIFEYKKKNLLKTRTSPFIMSYLAVIYPILTILVNRKK